MIKNTEDELEAVARLIAGAIAIVEAEIENKKLEYVMTAKPISDKSKWQSEEEAREAISNFVAEYNAATGLNLTLGMWLPPVEPQRKIDKKLD